MFILLRFGSQVEAEPFRTSGAGKSVDFAWSLVVMAIPCYFFGTMFAMPFLGTPMLPGSPYLHTMLLFGGFFSATMLSAIVYLWGCLNPETSVSIWGIRFKGGQLPWGIAFFKIVTDKAVLHVLLGYAIGHLFYFFVDVYPRRNQTSALIKTPVFFINMADAIQGKGPTVGRRHHATGQHNWGCSGGRRLGTK